MLLLHNHILTLLSKTPFITFSSPTPKAFIFLHLPSRLTEMFCLSELPSLLHTQRCLPSLSCSACSLSLHWSVQQGRVTFLGCLLHMVHIPAGLQRGPPLLIAGTAETSLKLSVPAWLKSETISEIKPNTIFFYLASLFDYSHPLQDSLCIHYHHF